jgi:lysophospholipase L1-like esterase
MGSKLSAAKLAAPVMGMQSYWKKIRVMFGPSLVGHWPLWDASGTVASDVSGKGNHAAYDTVTLADANSIKRKPCPAWPGHINLYSAGFEAAYNTKEGAFSVWAKVNESALWSDGVARHLLYIYVDSNNRLIIRRSNVDANKIEVIYLAGGTNKSLNLEDLQYTDWFNLTISWSLANDKLSAYLNGLLFTETAGVGTWVEALDPIRCLVGANTIANVNPWLGWISDPFMVSRPVTAAEALAAYEASGIRNLRLTVFGDSISDGTTDWPYPFGRRYNNGRIKITNRATAGHSIMSNLDGQVAAAASDHAGLIIIHMGTNDNDAGDMGALQAKVESNLATLKSTNPAARIYFANVLPRWTDNSGAEEVDKANIRAAIAAACTAQGVTCWDTYTVPWIDAADTEDGCHPTLAGRYKLANAVVAALA